MGCGKSNKGVPVKKISKNSNDEQLNNKWPSEEPINQKSAEIDSNLHQKIQFTNKGRNQPNVEEQETNSPNPKNNQNQSPSPPPQEPSHLKVADPLLDDLDSSLLTEKSPLKKKEGEDNEKPSPSQFERIEKEAAQENKKHNNNENENEEILLAEFNKNINEVEEREAKLNRKNNRAYNEDNNDHSLINSKQVDIEVEQENKIKENGKGQQSKERGSLRYSIMSNSGINPHESYEDMMDEIIKENPQKDDHLAEFNNIAI